MTEKLSGSAAVVHAVRGVDVEADTVTMQRQRNAALVSVTADDLERIIHAQFDAAGVALCAGVGASPGAAVGRVYFSADDAADAVDSYLHELAQGAAA